MNGDLFEILSGSPSAGVADVAAKKKTVWSSKIPIARSRDRVSVAPKIRGLLACTCVESSREISEFLNAQCGTLTNTDQTPFEA